MKKIFACMLSVMLFIPSVTLLHAEEITPAPDTNEESSEIAPQANEDSATNPIVSTLQSKIDSVNNGETIILDADYTESIIVSESKTVTIDLNGHTLTNKDGEHTITNKGNLTITGSGIVDNISHARGAILNYPLGTVTLNGGTYTRSKEAGSSSSDSGSNSWYTIKNLGTMTINQDVTVNQGADGNGKFSSLIANGWYTYPIDNGIQAIDGQTAKLTINGGKISGGLNAVKNDDNGEMLITGGQIIGYAQHAILNWNILKITGGVIKSEGSTKAAIHTSYGNNQYDKGITEITGGEISSNITCIDTLYNPTVKISGGAYSNDVSKYLVAGYNCVNLNNIYKVVADSEQVPVNVMTPAADETILNNLAKVIDNNGEVSNDKLQTAKILEIKISDITPTSEEKTSIETTVKYVLGDNAYEYSYFDLSLYAKSIDNESIGKITELNEEAQITIYLDDETMNLINGKEFSVVRVHDNESRVLEHQLEGNKLTFKTNLFSTYALVIKSTSSSPSSTPSSSKQSSGWDDGGPFTTDTCGNVFDRWGNKIYEANGCNVGGYNLVRTSTID